MFCFLTSKDWITLWLVLCGSTGTMSYQPAFVIAVHCIMLSRQIQYCLCWKWIEIYRSPVNPLTQSAGQCLRFTAQTRRITINKAVIRITDAVGFLDGISFRMWYTKWLHQCFCCHYVVMRQWEHVQTDVSALQTNTMMIGQWLPAYELVIEHRCWRHWSCLINQSNLICTVNIYKSQFVSKGLIGATSSALNPEKEWGQTTKKPQINRGKDSLETSDTVICEGSHSQDGQKCNRCSV